jgi:hypothetical protein
MTDAEDKTGQLNYLREGSARGRDEERVPLSLLVCQPPTMAPATNVLKSTRARDKRQEKYGPISPLHPMRA